MNLKEKKVRYELSIHKLKDTIQERPFLGFELLKPTKNLLASFVRTVGECSGFFY